MLHSKAVVFQGSLRMISNSADSLLERCPYFRRVRNERGPCLCWLWTLPASNLAISWKSLRLASELGFYIIIDLHGAPGAQAANNQFPGRQVISVSFTSYWAMNWMLYSTLMLCDSMLTITSDGLSKSLNGRFKLYISTQITVTTIWLNL